MVYRTILDSFLVNMSAVGGYYLPPTGDIVIKQVCWLARLFVTFIDSVISQKLPV